MFIKHYKSNAFFIKNGPKGGDMTKIIKNIDKNFAVKCKEIIFVAKRNLEVTKHNYLCCKPKRIITT